MWVFKHSFTIWPLALSILVFALLAVLIPRLCYTIICKDSIVDRLRYVE